MDSTISDDGIQHWKFIGRIMADMHGDVYVYYKLTKLKQINISTVFEMFFPGLISTCNITFKTESVLLIYIN